MQIYVSWHWIALDGGRNVFVLPQLSVCVNKQIYSNVNWFVANGKLCVICKLNEMSAIVGNAHAQLEWIFFVLVFLSCCLFVFICDFAMTDMTWPLRDDSDAMKTWLWPNLFLPLLLIIIDVVVVVCLWILLFSVISIVIHFMVCSCGCRYHIG